MWYLYCQYRHDSVTDYILPTRCSQHCLVWSSSVSSWYIILNLIPEWKHLLQRKVSRRWKLHIRRIYWHACLYVLKKVVCACQYDSSRKSSGHMSTMDRNWIVKDKSQVDIQDERKVGVILYNLIEYYFVQFGHFPIL